MKAPDGSNVPEILKFCAYHTTSCVGEHEEDNELPKVKIPNQHALCSECLVQKGHGQQMAITPRSAPGVAPVTLESAARKLEQAKANKEDDKLMESLLTEKSRCSWKPNHEELMGPMKEFICKNFVFRNPETKQLMPTCAMHVKLCIRVHDGGGVIDVPNVHALCTMHHTAEHGLDPPVIDFPYPGMESKLKDKAWMIQAGHFAAPNWRPDEDVIAAEYIAPKEPESYFESITKQAELFFWKRRFKREGTGT